MTYPSCRDFPSLNLGLEIGPNFFFNLETNVPKIYRKFPTPLITFRVKVDESLFMSLLIAKKFSQVQIMDNIEKHTEFCFN